MTSGGRHIGLVCVLAIAGLLALAPSASALSRPRDLAGAALHPWRLETRSYAPMWPLRDPSLRERTFGKLEEAGIRRARVDLKWSTVQPYPTTLVNDWSEFDGIVASARRHHVQLEPIVAFTPGWANHNQGPWVYPTYPSQFEDFLAGAMARYPDIPMWEIWNEPNSSLFSPPRPDAGKFVLMLRAASRARERAGSNARIVSGGLTPGAEVEVPEFAEQIARLGAFRYADALGVHPYSHLRPDRRGSSFLELPKLHSRVSRVAGRQVDLWITEYGFPNARVRSGYGPPAGEQEQATRLQRAFAIAVGWPWLKRLTWYGFRDDCANPRHADCRFGLLNEDFSPKRAWYGLLQVLAGNLPSLDTAISLRRKSGVVRRRRKRRRVHSLSGGVFMPGTDPARGKVVVTAKRRYRRRRGWRRITTTLVNGRYNVSLGRLRRGRWHFRAEFKGNSRYSPSSSRTLFLRVRKRR